MVKYSDAALDNVFGALADPTRRAILARLATGQTSLMELAQPHKMSLVAVQKHVRVLERAGLVETEKEGRVRRCTLQPQPLRTAAEWIEFYQKFWEDQFDALEQYIEEMKKEDPSWRPQPKPQDIQPKSRESSPRPGYGSGRRGRKRIN